MKKVAGQMRRFGGAAVYAASMYKVKAGSGFSQSFHHPRRSGVNAALRHPIM
jgi:hypothetical protein